MNPRIITRYLDNQCCGIAGKEEAIYEETLTKLGTTLSFVSKEQCEQSRNTERAVKAIGRGSDGDTCYIQGWNFVYNHDKDMWSSLSEKIDILARGDTAMDDLAKILGAFERIVGTSVFINHKRKVLMEVLPERGVPDLVIANTYPG